MSTRGPHIDDGHSSVTLASSLVSGAHRGVRGVMAWMMTLVVVVSALGGLNIALATPAQASSDIAQNYDARFSIAFGSTVTPAVDITTYDSGTGDFSGSGTSPSMNVSGNVSGSDVSMTWDYTDGSGYVASLTGTIASDGSMSGTFTDNASGSGTWGMVPSDCTPTIASVSTIAAEQTQTVTITGSCFGFQPTFTDASWGTNFQINDSLLSSPWQACMYGSAVSCSVSAWSSTSITFTGFSGSYGNSNWYLADYQPVTVNVWSPQTGVEATGCFVVVGSATSDCATEDPTDCTPTITSVSTIANTQSQDVTVTGSCLGLNAPFTDSSTGTYFQVGEPTAEPAWQGCYDGSAMTCSVTSWSPTSIVFTGFGSDYGQSDWTMVDGQSVVINVWNPQSGTQAAGCVIVVGSSNTSCATGDPFGCTPHINTVGEFVAGATQDVTITGTCFGWYPSYTDENTNNLGITDTTYPSESSPPGATSWEACFAPASNDVYCDVSSWTNTSITFSGYASGYGESNWVVNGGDHLIVYVTNPLSGNGPSACHVTVGVASTTCSSGEPVTATYGTGTATVSNDTCTSGPGTVDCASGDMNDSFKDISIPGPGGGLSLSRTYNSLGALAPGLFGDGWSCSYCMSLTTNVDGSVSITEGDGSQAIAEPDGSNYTLPAMYDSTLTHNGDGTWTFVRHQVGTWTFNSDGQLTGMTDLNGYTTTLTYNVGGDLTGITDAAGAELTVTENGDGQITSIEDPLGQTTTYTYTGSELTGVSNANGDAWTYRYDANGNMTTLKDPNGNAITTTFDSAHQVLTQTQQNGAETTYGYSGDPFSNSGGSTLITDPNGNKQLEDYSNGELMSLTKAYGTGIAATWTYTYNDTTLSMTSETDPNGYTTDYTYDGDGNLLTKTDPYGNETVYTYNSLNEPLTVTQPNGVETTNTYDAEGNIETTSQPLTGGGNATTTHTYGDVSLPGYATGVEDPNGHTTTYTYTSSGQVATETAPSGAETSYTYDADGRELTKVSPEGNVGGHTPSDYTTSYTYNALNEPVTMTNPLGHETTYTHDSDGNLTSTTDPLGNVTDTIYNSVNEPTEVTYKNAAGDIERTTLTGYDSDGNVTSTTDGNGNETTYTYNALNQKTSETNAAGDETTWTHDGDGNVLTVVSPDGNVSGGDPSHYTTTYTYDKDDRLLSTTNPVGNVTSKTYDANGNVATQMDGMGDVTTSTYDDQSRPTQVEVKTSGGTVVQTTSTTYDANGNVLSTTDGNSNATTYTYNVNGELASSTTPGGKETTSTYDADGNLATTTEPSGDVVTSSYNAADELTGTSYSDGTTHSVSYSYDADGNVLTMADGTGTSTWTYNSLGEETSYENGTGETIDYGYDAAGNDTSITYPNGHAVDQTFNDVNLETAVTDWHGNESTFTYDANGNLTAEDLPNGVTNSYTFDYANNLAGIDDTTTAGGGSTIFSASYTRNANALTTGDSSQPSATQNYQYTALDQVCYQGSTASNSCTSPPSGATTYSYDEGGNLTSNAGTTQSFNSDDELCWAVSGSSGNACGTAPVGATTYSYDANGNRTAMTPSSGAATAYSFNGANEMAGYQLGAGTATSYAYDGAGLLQSETTGTLTNDLSWNDTATNPLLLTQTTGVDTTDYIYGPQGLPLEEILPSGDIYYYSQDSLGSTRVLTDASGSVADTATYSAYGTLTASTGSVANDLLYAGQYSDSNSGLDYMRARWYDPTTAQFTTIDPLVQETLSPYAYVMGDPINMVDPSGDACAEFWDTSQCNNPLTWLLRGGGNAPSTLAGTYAISPRGCRLTVFRPQGVYNTRTGYLEAQVTSTVDCPQPNTIAVSTQFRGNVGPQTVFSQSSVVTCYKARSCSATAYFNFEPPLDTATTYDNYGYGYATIVGRNGCTIDDPEGPHNTGNVWDVVYGGL